MIRRPGREPDFLPRSRARLNKCITCFLARSRRSASRLSGRAENADRVFLIQRPLSVDIDSSAISRADLEKARALAPADRRADRSGVYPPAPVYRINIVVRLDVRLARSLALADASAGGIDLLAKRHLALRVRARGRTRNSAKSLGTDSKVGS